MGWREKELQKHKMRKMIEQIMNMPEYKEAKRKDEEQSVLRAMVNIAFITCVYLEMKYRCKKNGLENYLNFLKDIMEEVGIDEDWFVDADAHFRKEYNLNAYELLGVAIGEEDNARD